MAVVVCPSCRRNIPGNSFEKNICPECRGMINPGDFRQGLVRGTTLYSGKYEVERQIGRGGFAITYLAKARIGREYTYRVIKEYFPNEFAESRRPKDTNTIVVRQGRQLQFEQYHAAFNLEASHMDALRNVPGVVRYYDYFEENNTWYIVMEALNGQDLFHYTISKPAQCLQLNEALSIIRQILQIMAKVYSVKPTSGERSNYSLIHRDLSMGNVFMSQEGKITILDFGSSRYMFEPIDPSSKAHYTPVEQIENRTDQGQYTDIYSIGKLLYFLLCGKWPRDVSNKEWKENKAKYTLPPVRNSRPEIPAAVDDIIQKATRYDYHERYQTAEEFLKALESIGKPTKGLRLALIGAGVLAAGLFAVILLPKDAKEEDASVVQITQIATMVPSVITTEALKEYAYCRAAQGAALCTQKDQDSIIAVMMTDEVVYALQQEGDWTYVLLNIAGQEVGYYMETGCLQQLSRTEGEEYEALASIDGSAIVTRNSHYLRPADITSVQQETTAPLAAETHTPILTSKEMHEGKMTEFPRPTPSGEVRVFVEFVDERGMRIDEALYEVGYGEDLTIGAGKVSEHYEIPQETTYAIQWGEDGHIQNGSITVQCQPTPVPGPVWVTVRYMTEAGELLTEEEVQVSYEQNFFIPRTSVGDYTVVVNESPVVSWNEDGSIAKNVFTFYCVPPVTLIYGQSLEIAAADMKLSADVRLRIETDGYASAVQTEDGIRLTAEIPGDGKVVISDGNKSYTVKLRVVPAVRALSSMEVVLDDVQDEAVVALDVEEGVQISDFSYSTEQDRISVSCKDNQLRFKANGYVNDWVVVTVGGRSFRVNVRMKDKLETMQMYRVKKESLYDRTAWMPVTASMNENLVQLFFSSEEAAEELLLLCPSTYSERLDGVTGSEGTVFNETLGVFEVDLSVPTWQKAEAKPVRLSVDDSIMEVGVCTVDVVTNRIEIVQALNKTFVSGSTAETTVELHPAVKVSGCSSVDEKIAVATYENGRLLVKAVASGDTEVQLELSQGEVLRIPVSVRQRVEELIAKTSSACVGKELTVQIISQDAALTDEFTAKLDNTCFSVVRKTADSVVLRAESTGTAELTVTDTFGGAARISLRACSVVEGLSKAEVTIRDGEKAIVQLQLVEGEQLPADIVITHDIEGLVVTRKGAELTFAAEKNRCVSGSVAVDVNGERFTVQVSTENRITGVRVYHAAVKDLKNPECWEEKDLVEPGTYMRYAFQSSAVKNSCLIFAVETLTGSNKKLMVSDQLDYDQGNDVYFISLDASVLREADVPALSFALGDSEANVRVYTGDLLNNMEDVLQQTSAVLQAGKSVQTELSLYEGASVQECVSGNAAVAKAVCENGVLTIGAVESGETAIRLTLAPTGETLEIPVTVRQSLETITADTTTAYLDQNIIVHFSSPGKPLDEEFICSLDNDTFDVVERTESAVILRAKTVGKGTLTVTDTFGNSQQIALQACSTVTGMNKKSIQLTDGETATLQICVAEGTELSENISIRSGSDALEIKRSGKKISLKIAQDQYVSTTVEVVVDGIAYPVKVSTKDRLTKITVWRTNANEIQKKKTWEYLGELKNDDTSSFLFDDTLVEGDYLIFEPETLSGSLKQLVLTGGLTLDEKLGVCLVALDEKRFTERDAEPLTITVGESGSKVQVYTGSLVTNLNSVKKTLSVTLAAGENTRVPLETYVGAKIVQCEVENPEVASASVEEGQLVVKGINSGNTTICLTMQPTDERIIIPVTIRQPVGKLTADGTDTYIGETIVVDVGSKGVPVEDEFVYALTGDCFKVIECGKKQICLKAVKPGTTELTVTDCLGGSNSIMLNAASTVLGLSESKVTLTDGELQTVKFNVVEGKTVTEDIKIINQLEGLTVSCKGGELSLTVDKGKYVTGNIQIVADGQTFSLAVTTKDRLMSSSIVYPDKESEKYASLAKTGTIYLKVRTLSGKQDKVGVSGPWRVDEVGANLLRLEYTGKVSALASPCELKVLLNDKEVKTFTVEYPNVVLSLPDGIRRNKAGSAVEFTVGEDGLQTLFGTLDGLECTGDGLTITKVDSKTLRVECEIAGTSKLKITDNQGKICSQELTFDAYLSGVKVNDTHVATGKSMELEMTEGDSLTVALQIKGGKRDDLTGFEITTSGGYAELTGKGNELTLKALKPGSVTFALTDKYSDITLKVSVAMLWRFPNEETTAEEIREISAALCALDFQPGRTTSKWNDNLETGIRAWKKARGYTEEAVLYRAEYEQLLAEGGTERKKNSVAATPIPAFVARTGEIAYVNDIAAGSNQLYLLDSKGWILVMSKTGDVLDAFPAEESARFTQLYDTGDVPMAQDSGQMYMLHENILDNVVTMYPHQNSSNYLYNILTEMQSTTVSSHAAMSQNGMMIVLAEDQKFSVDGRIINMYQGQVLYSMNNGTLMPMFTDAGKTMLCSKVSTGAVDGSTIVMAAANQLYLFGESNGLITHYGLKNTQRQPASLRAVVNGKTLQLTCEQVVMSDRNLAIRQKDGSVLVGGADVPGSMGNTVNKGDTFSVCNVPSEARDIALSDTTLYILTKDGSLYAQGKGSSTSCDRILKEITAVSADDRYGYAVTLTGEVYRMDGCNAELIASKIMLP